MSPHRRDRVWSLVARLAALVAAAVSGPLATAATVRPLIVVTEGFDSCQESYGDPAHEALTGITTQSLDAMRQSVYESTGIIPHVLFACFGPPGIGTPSPWQSLDLRMQDQDDYASFRVEDFDSPFQQTLRSDLTHNVLPRPLAAWFSAIATAAAAGEPLYLIGHSYGAWLAMEAVQVIGVTPRLLVTIDSISPLGCGPSEVNGRFPTVPLGCKCAPEDFSPTDYVTIGNHSAYWLNVFQTNFTRLHSGPVAGSNYNWILDDGAPIMTNFHVEIGRDDRIWNWIGGLIKADYGS